MEDDKLSNKQQLFEIKDKLSGIQDKVKEGIADTNCISSKIAAFGKGMSEAE